MLQVLWKFISSHIMLQQESDNVRHVLITANSLIQFSYSCSIVGQAKIPIIKNTIWYDYVFYRLWYWYHFIPNAPFLYSLKTENRMGFWCFQGVEKGFRTLATMGYVVTSCQSIFTLIERRICMLVSGLKSIADNFSVNTKYILGNWSLLTEYHPEEFIYRQTDRWPASLLEMSPFHRWFSNILLVKTNYLVST